jgi:hypothetical protein
MNTGTSSVISTCKNAPPMSITAVLLPSCAAMARTVNTLHVDAVGADRSSYRVHAGPYPVRGPDSPNNVNVEDVHCPSHCCVGRSTAVIDIGGAFLHAEMTEDVPAFIRLDLLMTAMMTQLDASDESCGRVV